MPEQRDRTIDPQAMMTIVAPGTFAALGIPLKSGRDFNDGDTGNMPLVAIVNEALVRKSLAARTRLAGRSSARSTGQTAMTIVGVVGDARQRNPALWNRCQSAICRTGSTRTTARRSMLSCEPHGDPVALAGTVRRLVAEDIAGGAGVVHDHGGDGLERCGRSAIPRAVVCGVCRAGGLSCHGGRLRRDGVCRVNSDRSEIGLRMALGASTGAPCCG